MSKNGEQLVYDEYLKNRGIHKIRFKDSVVIQVHVIDYGEGPFPTAEASELASRIIKSYNALDGLEPEKLGALIEKAQKVVSILRYHKASLTADSLVSALDALGVPRG